MCTKCENCELLLQIEEERIQWCKDLTSKNIRLHKKIIEQQELIGLLKNRLLEKQRNFLSDYVKSVMQQVNYLQERTSLQNDYLLEENLKEKLDEVTEVLNLYNNERETLQKEIEDGEKYFSENITYLHGLVDYFRESLFYELDKSNKLKLYFTKKMTELTTTSHHVVLHTLKEQGEILNNELKSRYQKTIQKSKEETERQSQLVSKLRKHNKQLYLQIHKTKIDSEQKVAKLERSLQDLKATITKLKEKNDYLHTQIKLEVEGCQNDISDTRKTLKKLIKSKS
ncbi:hypothetical protein Zmor_002679 [Zophobas morio]|uniref:Uncharacterized protein n=1 Tax=Zophobas morio TaxID=2755281 RepID=A0AA38HQF8_9CUCU|nr:hypothetical protein Zmor_002679 [Zophobas morio]